MKKIILIGVFAIIGLLLAVQNAEAKTQTSKISISALGFDLEGTLTIYDDDGDGHFDRWVFEGTLDPPIGSKKKVKIGGKFNVVGGNGGNNNQLPGNMMLAPQGFEFETDGENIRFSIPIILEDGTTAGTMRYNDDYTGSPEALVFIYSDTHLLKNIHSGDVSTTKVDLGIKIVSQNNKCLVYEFNSPYDKSIDLFVYDIMGNVIEHYIWCGKGISKNTVENLVPGKYFIYSPIDKNSACSVIVTE